MTIRHSDNATVDEVIFESDGLHEDTESITYYGAVADGSTDCLAAFTAAAAAGGARVPAGDYYLSAPVAFAQDGVCFRGAGIGVTRLLCAGGAFEPGATDLRHISLSNMTIRPTDAALVTNANGQEYSASTGIDLTGTSYSIVRDVRVEQFATGLKLETTGPTTRSYYNHIGDLQVWGGATGIFIGGDNDPRDGANANSFHGCAIVGAQVGVLIRGASNTFTGLRIENPSQATGYPATAIGIQFDSGYYAINNIISGVYCELIGTGNKGVYFHYSGLSGAWCTPNWLAGGTFTVNGGDETPTFDAQIAAQAYGQHFEAMHLHPTRRLVYSPDGTLQQVTYKNGGGILITDSSGSTLWQTA